jgi:hypothetical protein
VYFASHENSSDGLSSESDEQNERCLDALNEEKPVEKTSKVAMIFGFSMLTAGAVTLSVGLAALWMGGFF